MSDRQIESQWSTVFKQLVRYVGLVFIALLGFYMATGFFYVGPKQIGVQQRFGKIIDGYVEPGLHYALPRPFDRITLVESKSIHSVMVDDFASDNWEYESRAYRFIKKTNLKPYCITGDNNIVNVSLLIKYSVVKPESYLKSNKDAEMLIKGFAASSILSTVASLGVDEVLTFGKKRLESVVMKRLQHRLDEFDSGIGVVFVEIQEISPPMLVQPYFDDVINAKQQRRKALNVAQALKNRVIPEAREYANRLNQEALAYRSEQILLSQGEASRFEDQLNAFNKARALVNKQIYFEFTKELKGKLKEIRIVDP